VGSELITGLKVHDVMVANPVTIEPNALITEAAILMRDNKIGSVIVVEKQKVVGIVTERDLVRRGLAENRDLTTVKIRDVMSVSVVSVSPEEDVVNTAHIMRQRGIRRVVVMDKEDLVGIITTNDLVRNMKQNIEELGSILYIVGRTWM
jgi:CBS domain-containing protein